MADTTLRVSRYQSVAHLNPATPLLRASVETDHRWESSLIAEAKAGSLAAFDQIVQRYSARVLRVAQSLAHTREDAEEIAQNAFVQAFRHLSDFRGDSRFCTWLVRITMNEGLMRLRRQRLNEISIDNSCEGNSPSRRELQDWAPTPEQRYSREELRSILTTTIGQLPPRYRTVFQLRQVEGFSTRETAQALDLSLTAVKSRLRRARIALRNSLDKRFALQALFHNRKRERPGSRICSTGGVAASHHI